MPVMICIAGCGNVKLVFYIDQFLHGIWRRWIHAYLAIPVNGHKPEGWVNLFVDNGKIQFVMFSDRLPVMYPCASERINTYFDVGIPDNIHINHFSKIIYIRVKKIISMRS